MLQVLEHDLRQDVVSGDKDYWYAFRVTQELRKRRPVPDPDRAEVREIKRKRRLRALKEQLSSRQKAEARVRTLDGIAHDETKRLFFDANRKPGPVELKYLSMLSGNFQNNGTLATVRRFFDSQPLAIHNSVDIALDSSLWYQQLLRNDPPSARFIADLTEIEKLEGSTNQGPSLGAFCERRFGLAAAILQDCGLIEGFSLCGEAGLPLTAIQDEDKRPFEASKSSALQRLFRAKVDYAAHEETMAVDSVLHLKSENPYEYALIQIKASGTVDLDRCYRYIALTKYQRDKLIYLCPESRTLFKIDFEEPGRFLLPVQRSIQKIPIIGTKIMKESEGDGDDIANRTMSLLEQMEGNGKTLILNRPYHDLDLPEKVAALLKQGFLTLVEDKPENSPLVRIHSKMPKHKAK